MSITKDDHWLRIGQNVVRVTGESGRKEATWRLLVDEVEVDAKTATGTFSLHATLPEGDAVEAQIDQGSLGPTAVSLVHDGVEVTSWKGFVL